MLRKKKKGTKERHKELELVSLIDIVFLLMVFGLVLAMGGIMKIGGRGSTEEMLRINIQREISGEDAGLVKAVVKYPQSFQMDSVTVRFPDDRQYVDRSFDDLIGEEPWRRLRDGIERYRESSTGYMPISVRSSDDIPFKIIDFLIRQCSEMGFGELELVWLGR